MDKRVILNQKIKKQFQKQAVSSKKLQQSPLKENKNMSKKSACYEADRFIPSRIDLTFENADDQVLNIFSKSKKLKTNEKSSYLKMIESELLENSTPIQKNLFTNNNETKRKTVIYSQPSNKTTRSNLASTLKNMQSSVEEAMGSNENFPKQVDPLKSFNFGVLADNFYSNVFDWSVSENAIIATNKSMIMFNPLKYFQTSLQEKPAHCYDSNSEITAIKQMDAEHVIVFNKNIVSTVEIKNNKIMSIEAIDKNLIVLGSENSFVFFMDLRFKNSLTPLYEHMNEVCKVKYNPGLNLLASGGNDNKILLYDMRGKNKFIKVFSHNAAIKALDFHKQKSVLISGGGTSDKKIKLWDLKKFELIDEHPTDNQISNLYSHGTNNIITANGYVSNNIEIWKKESVFRKIFQFKPHQKRILFLTKSLDEKYLLSGSCDGVLNLWRIPEDCDKPNSFLSNELIR